MKKKFFSLLLIILMTAFSSPALTVTAEGVCVAKIGTLEYASFEEAIEEASTNDTVTLVKAGTYELPTIIPNNVKIVSETDVQVNCTQEGNVCSVPSGCTFENITLILALSPYHGFQDSGKIIMNNCTIKGLLEGYSDMEFNNCTFYAPGTTESGVDATEYAMWTYCGNITYNNCEFFSKGKCMNIYNEGYPRTVIRFNGCTFHSTVKNKAAINVKETVVPYNRLLDFDVYIDENCKIAEDSVNYFPTSGASTDTLNIIDSLVQVDDIALDKETVSKSEDPGVFVHWKSKIVYSSFPVEDPDPEDDPTPTPTPQPTPEQKEEYVAPTDENGAIDIKADIVDNKAIVGEILTEQLEQISKSTDDESQIDSIIIDLSHAKQVVKTVELSKLTVKNLSDVITSKENEISTVIIVLSKASVEIDAQTLEVLYNEAQGNAIQLVVDDTKSKDFNASQQASLDGMDVSMTFEAYFESNGQRIHDFKGGIATVSIKFEPKKGKNANNYKVYYIEESGKMTKYATKFVDGMLKFATTHFSDYAIVYDTSVDVLLLKAKTSGSKVVKLSWNGMDNASKYVVYGAKCGKNYKKLKTITGKAYTVKKIAGKKLKAHKAYKFYVVGYDAVGNKVSSKSIHFVTANTQGKYANIKSIKAKYNVLLLSVGVTQKIGAKYKMYAGKKHLGKGHGPALRFVSTNPEVATVSSSGNIKAVGKGTATIYIQDIGGKYCKTKVTVE